MKNWLTCLIILFVVSINSIAADMPRTASYWSRNTADNTGMEQLTYVRGGLWKFRFYVDSGDIESWYTYTLKMETDNTIVSYIGTNTIDEITSVSCIDFNVTVPTNALNNSTMELIITDGTNTVTYPHKKITTKTQL